MKTILFLVVVLSLNTFGQTRESAIEKLSRIPVAKQPSPSLRGWRNPVLTLMDDKGIYVNDSEPVPIERLLNVLAELPETAWPYGRVVALSGFVGLRGFSGSEKITKRVETLLKSANIEVVHENSA